MAEYTLNYSGAEISEKLDKIGYTIPDYWQSTLDEAVAKIKALQDAGGKECFSFAVMTDVHHNANLGKCSPSLARHIMDKCGIMYALVIGDLQSRGSWNTKAEAEAEWESIKDMFEPLEGRALYQRGNHDGSWGATLNGVTYPYNFTPEELYNRVYADTYRNHDVETDESGSGYYVDDTARKVRYILLNTHCNQYTQNADGSAAYNNMSTFRFTQSQYDMVVEALQGMKEGWAAIVAAHVPVENNYSEKWGGSATEGDHVVMRNLLKAYKNKAAYSAEWAGTAGDASGGYTNLFDTSGDGFTDNTSKFYTNWLPYSNADNGGNGTIYHFKGLKSDQGYTNPYKMQFKYFDGNTTPQAYTTNANRQANVVADYDESVRIVQHLADDIADGWVQFEIREPLPDGLIITANEDIVEATGEGGYDAVSVSADFTGAKGELVGYFAGHMHADNVYSNADYGFGFPIITTRCDGKEENNSTLNAERVAGTATEQSFDVFTINRKTKKIYATKIGAGSDREINY